MTLNNKGDRDIGTPTNQDIETWNESSSQQSTIAHELGHVLNLDHINIRGKGCETGNEKICYGKPGTWMNRNVMGDGAEVNWGKRRSLEDRKSVV